MAQQPPGHPAIDDQCEHTEHLQAHVQVRPEHQEREDAGHESRRHQQRPPQRQWLLQMQRHPAQHHQATAGHRCIAGQHGRRQRQVGPQCQQGHPQRQQPQADGPLPQYRLPAQHHQQQREADGDADAEQEAKHGDGGKIQGHAALVGRGRRAHLSALPRDACGVAWPGVDARSENGEQCHRCTRRIRGKPRSCPCTRGTSVASTTALSSTCSRRTTLRLPRWASSAAGPVMAAAIPAGSA
ncbi:hypothetical protein G6F50_014475 [Rhizopus delemar]|uniref:Uncharacterized protein n=1 Tax=Rhizopus delemar TaxID=936053 RepID=A0A9P7C7Q7_9FUNG|nr:hypothetical protein G6F50_014475 [Rhizopus delemar]